MKHVKLTRDGKALAVQCRHHEGKMTKEEAIRFKESWAAVNRFMIEEERSKSFEQRLKELGMLYRTGKLLGWRQRPPGEEDAVRARWQTLREKLGGKLVHG